MPAKATAEPGEGQDEPASQDVAHVAERQAVGGQHRDEQAGRSGSSRRPRWAPARKTQLDSSVTSVSLRKSLAMS